MLKEVDNKLQDDDLDGGIALLGMHIEGFQLGWIESQKVLRPLQPTTVSCIEVVHKAHKVRSSKNSFCKYNWYG